MKLTSPFTVIASRLSRSSPDGYARIAFAAVILVGAAHIAGAQTPQVATSIAPHHTPWELPVSPRSAPTEPQHSGGARVAGSERPSIVIDSPAPDSTVRGPAIIVFRTDNVRITSVFVPEALDASAVRA